jgi:hypothetical protein
MTHEQFIQELDAMVDVDLCVDCVFADANGQGAEGISEDWTGFLPEWDGWLFGPVVTDEDNEPAEAHFSWSTCDGCGSMLGGDRWDYIAVPKHTIKKGE